MSSSINFSRILCVAVLAAICFPAISQNATVWGDDAAVVDAPVSVDVFGAGTLKVPTEFKKAAPKSRIIEHEFSITEGEGDDAPTARVTMMAAGGDVAANIDRWKGQFSGDAKKVGETETAKRGAWETHVIEISGEFSERMGGGPFAGGKMVKHDNHAMMGAILVHPEGRKYFVKLIGPASVIEANRDAFKKMIASIAD